MKPYIAILIDSFWEAVSNKVLWALLICWSLVLLALMPFGYVSETSYKLNRWDIQDRAGAADALRLATRGGGSPEMQAIASKLKPEFADKLKKISSAKAPELENIKSSDLAKELNHVLKASDLYDEDVFVLPKEGKRRERLDPLINADADSLSELDRDELNRELIHMGMKRYISRAQGEQLWIGYGGFKLGNPIPISRRAIREYIEPLILSGIIKLGLGVLAVLVAIVVTSPIIPDTFKSGSLHLLLSKPISRVWLYLSKFFGGTIFVLVNITFVLTGLYLIAGIRFDIWNAGLLACIPILMFVFVIFYTVSALAGLIWGNAIVCVISCMVFWASCFAIGAVHDAMSTHFEVSQQATRVVPIADDLLVVDNEGRVNVWNSEFSVWQPAMESESRRKSRTFGPFYDEENQRIISKSFFTNQFGNLGAKNRDLNLISLADDDAVGARNESETAESETAESETAESETAESETAESETAESETDTADPDEANSSDGNSAGDDDSDEAPAESDENAADDDEESDEVDSAEKARETPRWASDAATPLPEQLYDVFNTGDRLIAVCRTDIYEHPLSDLKLVEQKPNFLGMKIPWMKEASFKKVTPEDYAPDRGVSSCLSQDRKYLATYSGGVISIMVCDGPKYAIETTRELEPEKDEDSDDALDTGAGNESALLLLNGQHCVIARAGSPIQVLDRELKLLHSVPIPDGGEPRQLHWMGETQQAAILTHSGECYKLDAAAGTISELALPIAGDVTAMNWLDQSKAWVVTKPANAYLVDVAGGEIIEKRLPQSTTWYSIFRWVVRPIYYVNPKPAALDNAMNYFLSGNKTQSLSIVANDLEEAQVEFDVWQPIVSNTAFVVFMLAVGSIYVLRREY